LERRRTAAYKKKNRKYKIAFTIKMNILLKSVDWICGRVPYIRIDFFDELPVM